ncbi:MAG: hypothetical protein IPP47_32940 [Bryobacterales bacterium]|nr:hypothetical protein [Bryobacterales bacterium]
MRPLLLLAMAASALAQTGPCSSEGTVLQDGNGAPVARARVLFRKIGAGSQLALGYFTDDNGAFARKGSIRPPTALAFTRWATCHPWRRAGRAPVRDWSWPRPASKPDCSTS